MRWSIKSGADTCVISYLCNVDTSPIRSRRIIHLLSFAVYISTIFPFQYTTKISTTYRLYLQSANILAHWCTDWFCYRSDVERLLLPCEISTRALRTLWKMGKSVKCMFHWLNLVMCLVVSSIVAPINYFVIKKTAARKHTKLGR